MDDLATRRDPITALRSALVELVASITGRGDAARYVSISAQAGGTVADVKLWLPSTEDVRRAVAALSALRTGTEQTAQEAIAEVVGDGMTLGGRR